jgi:hypothetical protein
VYNFINCVCGSDLIIVLHSSDFVERRESIVNPNIGLQRLKIMVTACSRVLVGHSMLNQFHDGT